MEIYQSQKYAKHIPNSIYFVVLSLAIIIVYYPILNNQLLDFWDDQWVVMNSYTESGINLQNIGNIFTEFYHGQYAPFNEFLYLFLYSVSGYNTFAFHLASLILHLINSCLIFIVIKKLFTLNGKIETDRIPIISFITALIFCLHPLNVESVAWMSASKVLVYALFYLLATYTFLLYLEKGKICFYIFTVILYIFSFLSKEQAVVFPLWLLLIYWILNYNFSKKKVWATTIPFFILSLLFGIVTLLSQSAAGVGFLTDEVTYPLWQRIIFGCYSYLEYIFKIIFPFKLSYLYPFPSVVGDPLRKWLLIYPALIIIIVATLWKYFKLWPIAFGILFFTIHIALALHIIPLSRFAIVADRYAYLSIIGIGFIISYYFVRLYETIKKKSINMLVILIFSSYLLYFGIYANQRTYTWYNVDTLKKELRELLKERNDYNIIRNKNDNEIIF